MNEKNNKILVAINGVFVALGVLTVLGALISKGTAGLSNNQLAIAALMLLFGTLPWPSKAS